MEITSQLVKELREKTGAGMMDCKNALVEAAGDEDKAIEILRKKGLSRVAKRSGRDAKDGLVVALISPEEKRGVLVEVNCETEPVKNTDEFRNLVKIISEHLYSTQLQTQNPEELLNEPASNAPGKTLRDLYLDTALRLGENLVLRRFVRYEVAKHDSGIVTSYIHTGAKLGVLAQLDFDPTLGAQKGEIGNLAKEITLHLAAANPISITREEVPADLVNKEREIFKAQLEAEGKKKPPEVMEKIISGKLERFFSEVCLLDQPWVKAPEKTIKQLIAETSQKLGGQITVRRFSRFKIGE